ncbi:MAG: hypothetical protein PUP92_17170 [Rhizonema sp. PD38]|nr:hypothetical protein [Rhizonema sp. PD38]
MAWFKYSTLLLTQVLDSQCLAKQDPLRVKWTTNIVEDTIMIDVIASNA